jgi:hypothetical protein
VQVLLDKCACWKGVAAACEQILVSNGRLVAQSGRFSSFAHSADLVAGSVRGRSTSAFPGCPTSSLCSPTSLPHGKQQFVGPELTDRFARNLDREVCLPRHMQYKTAVSRHGRNAKGQLACSSETTCDDSSPRIEPRLVKVRTLHFR